MSVKTDVMTLVACAHDALAGAGFYAQNYDCDLPGGKEAFMSGCIGLATFALDVLDDYFCGLDMAQLTPARGMTIELETKGNTGA